MKAVLAIVLLFLSAAPVSGSKILRVGRGDRVGTGFVIASKTTGDKNFALMITARHVVETQGQAWANLPRLRIRFWFLQGYTAED